MVTPHHWVNLHTEGLEELCSLGYLPTIHLVLLFSTQFFFMLWHQVAFILLFTSMILKFKMLKMFERTIRQEILTRAARPKMFSQKFFETKLIGYHMTKY